MSASIWAEDFPSPKHDLRCSIWTSVSGPCTCRDDSGYTLAARLDLLVPVELACDDEIDEAS